MDRAVVRGYLGASEQLTGPVNKKVSFDVELAGSGAAATAPAWGALLQACAFAEALLTTPNRVEYTPISDGFKTATIYYYDSGVLHKLLGVMGTFKLSAKAGEIPKFTFEFTGLDGGDTVAANATPTLTAWKTPVVVAKANVVDITLGCSYAAGALSGGTVNTSTGLDLDAANQVTFNPTLNEETVDMGDRSISGNMQLKQTPTQEVDFIAAVKANTLTGLGFTIGTAAGNKVILFAPAVQRITPTKGDLNGTRVIPYGLRLCPLAGNDELRIITQ